MKSKILVIVFCWIVCVVNAQTATEKTAVWEYPVRLGTDEWRITSYAEKVEKSQPPKELLNSWDTETLFKYCVDYPFNHVTFMFNNPKDGFKRVYEQSTVWQEFIKRKDALNVFAQYFEARPLKRLFEISNTKVRTDELLTLFVLEKVVSETDFAVHLDSSGKRKLADIILHTHQGKKDYPNELFGFPYNSSLSALLKILECDQVTSSNDEISLIKFREKTGNESFIDERMETAIITRISNYINK